MRTLLILILLINSAAAQSGAYLSHVIPDLPGRGPGDEALAISCSADAVAECDISGWVVADGEGAWLAPDGTTIVPGESHWIAGDPTLLAGFDGPDAAAWNDTRFALANDGDGLILYDADGHEQDAFTWGPGGDVTMRSPGLVYTYDPETDSWITPRIHRIGESEIAPRSFDVDAITMYRSPENTYEILQDLIEGARQRLHLHVYDLRHPHLVHDILDAMERRPGLDVKVLVEDVPVGHDAEDREERGAALGSLVAAGAEVVTAGARYSHHHLKVLVADQQVAIQSENWVRSGVPVSGTWGNRGWGVVLDDPQAAGWFATWMAADRAAWDAEPWTETAAAPVRFADDLGRYRGDLAQHLIGDLEGDGTGRITATPIISPDHTAYPDEDPILARLQSATERIWTQQLALRDHESNGLGWSMPDRYVSALRDAAERGVDVRVMQERLGYRDHPWEAPFLRIWDHPDLGTLHNKGWIIDDAVVIGSMNGNHASRSANREVGVLLEGSAVATIAAGWFEEDEAAHDALPGLPTGVPIPAPWPIIIGVGLLVAARTRR